MRHFRGSRGSRSRSIVPRGSTRSAKYIVIEGPQTDTAGLVVTPFGVGTDNTTLGQTGVTDTAIPVGAKITKIEIFMPKVNLATSANFITWTIQRLSTGQAVVNPLTAGGNPLRKNILLTGCIGLGDRQNNNLHIKYNVPKKFQRMGDGDNWQIVTENTTAVSAQYVIIYKVFM